MNLDELRSVQSKERQKDSLQNLRPSFYQEVGEYIADLEDERDRVADQVDDPFSSPEVGRLTDEIETAKDVVEAIYERRMGKLVKQASLAAAGMAANDEGLTAEEADLFDDLVDRIGSNKSRVLDVLEGVDPADGAGEAGADHERSAATEPARGDEPAEPGSDPTAADPVDGAGPIDDAPAPSDAAGADDATTADDAPPVPPQEPPADVDPAASAASGESDTASADSDSVSPADVMGGDGPSIDEPQPPEPPADGPPGEPDATDSSPAASESRDEAGREDGTTDDVERVTVRITRDIGSILGVDDREYSLSTDDVVTLPEQNATPLLEQEAAESLE
ncbi:hypothetical protein [Natronolimnohabitans innermongolicus]|uniref:GINS subunit domain-containing protein n=1 Tax=Natronolimnohabitans innermongolicus JCM 12255 TaxID=1227499 RepID=L9WMH6_9EURY|nr:hypothetical protein [Natronolimnohabitans innermongolicus]ELY49518.1 hypothetical protein C493_20239 [Natronolimnohabitans innermongolicus JCM 12255]